MKSSRNTLHKLMLISEKVSLTEAAELLPKMNQFPGTGVTVIDRFCQA